MTVCTIGSWHAKPGQQDEFARLWAEVTESAVAEIGCEGGAVLLRDQEDHRHFLSVGMFQDSKALIEWRDGIGFRDRMDDLTRLLEHGQSSLFDVVEAVGSKVLRP